MPVKLQTLRKPDKPAAHSQLLLEQELRLLWQHAANTRKTSSARRLDTILRNSRSELALRDLLLFALYLVGAFVNLFKASLSALLNLPAQETQDAGNESLPLPPARPEPALPTNNSNESLP